MVNKEVKSLTGIRGVAAIYVAIFHYYIFYSKEVPDNFISSNPYLHSLFYHGYLGVDLFFVLSAFVITLSSRKFFEGKLQLPSYLHFMKRRWVRIYPTYFIMLVYAYIFVWKFQRTPNFLLNLTLLNSALNVSYIAGHFWSLSTEWVTYLIYPFFFKLSFYKSNNKWSSIIILIGLMILFFTSAIKWNHFDFNPFGLCIIQSYPSLFRCFGNYFLGIAAYQFFKKYPDLFLKSNFSSFIIVLSIVLLLFLQKADIFIVALLVPLIISIAYDKNIMAKILGSKVVHLLGVISYPFYLIHVFIISKLSSIGDLLSAYGVVSWHYSLLFIIFLILSLGIAYLFTTFLEKPIISSLTKRLQVKGFPVYLKSV